ncbi:DUF1441 family protein [Roseomonas genomospecies 6]|uniref:DUF1441 family protein n=1 Tax=Roseomonas genomospecies 6 TaxID=214106 RepID=A0A9W7KQN4_9PROT|nr:DUF1441 family protein [Roseomonas genomospecies 6]
MGSAVAADPEALWSINALAAALGMDRRTITKRLKETEPADKEGRHPVYRLGDAVRAIFELADAAQDDRNRSRLLAAQAEQAELNLERTRGELLSRADVERAAFETSRTERATWQGWPVRVGPVLAAELGIDHARLTAALEREVQRQLEDRAAPEMISDAA